MSPSGDKKYCWQGVLWDLAAVVTFLRSALKFAAVVEVQLDIPTWRPTGVKMTTIRRPFGAHLASIWSPFGGQRGSSWPRRCPRGSSGAQEAPRMPQDEPQRRPRGPKLSPRGAQEAPSGIQKAPNKAPRAAKKQPKSIWRAQRASC